MMPSGIFKQPDLAEKAGDEELKSQIMETD